MPTNPQNPAQSGELNRRLGMVPEIAAVMALFCLGYLLKDIMGVNEVDILPLARQFVDPSWIPQDWYLNQAPGYRLLFHYLAGTIAAHRGFLVASLCVRLLGYLLVAAAFVYLRQRLQIRLVPFLLAIAFFLGLGPLSDINPTQGAIAGEWIIGGAEAKVMAYGLILFAFGSLMGKFYVRAALLLGLATSFHVLVGGWATLSVVAWLLLFNPSRQISWRNGMVWVAIYAISGGLAIQPILMQLLASSPGNSGISTSQIYVFQRLPHHLNPLAWSGDDWFGLICYLVIFTAIALWLKFRTTPEICPGYREKLLLAELTLLSLVPFGVGLIIAPFDVGGQLLQYYPFRFGDVLLPLATYLLLIDWLDRLIRPCAQRLWPVGLLLVLGLTCGIPAVALPQDLAKLREFPAAINNMNPDWQAITTWIREHTATDVVIIAMPDPKQASFSWLTERATVANFKLLPQGSEDRLAWHERLADLSGHPPQWLSLGERGLSVQVYQDSLSEGYRRLSAAQVRALMEKYQASYFVTKTNHRLKLPEVYRNSTYAMYEKP